MSGLFASHISISNFRALPEDFELPIPPQPGLVIIYGMNGLGKTTVFEAAEWLMTGTVSRLRHRLRTQPQHDKSLTRRGAIRGSHRVSIHFNDGEPPLTRTATDGPSNDEVIDRLRDPDWRPRPSNASNYLRLTMFLPQSKQYRFDSAKGSEKWRMLEEPAGVERLNQIRSALTNRSTMNAFKRAIEQRQQALREALEDVQRYDELLKMRQSLSITDPATEMSDFDTARPELIRISLVLTDGPSPSAEASTGDSSLLDKTSALDDGDGRLWAAGVLRSSRERLQRFEDRLDDLRLLAKKANEFEATSREINALQDKLSSLQSSEEKTSGDVKSTKLQLNELSTQAESIQSRNDAASKAVKSLTTLIETQQELDRLQADRRQQSHILRATRWFESDVREIRTNVDAQVQRQAKLRSDIAGILQRRRSLDWLEAESIEIDKASKEAASHRTELAKVQTELGVVKESIPKMQQSIVILRQELRRLSDQRKDAIAEADRRMKAIATVCEHIAQNATTCPVCRSEFEAGELRNRVEQTMQQEGVDTASIDAELEENRLQLKQTQEAVNQAQTSLQQLPIRVKRLEVLLQEYEARERRFHEEAVENQVRFEAFNESVREQRAELTRNEQTFDADLQSIANESVLQHQSGLANRLATTLQARFAKTQVMLEQTDRENDRLQLERSHVLAILGKDAPLAARDPDEALQRASESRIRETANAAHIAQQRSPLMQQLTTLKSNLDSLTTERQTVEAQIAAGTQRMQLLTQTWTAMNLLEQPSTATLQTLVAEVEDQIRLLHVVARDAQRVATRLKAWHENQQVATVQRQLQELFIKSGAKVESDTSTLLNRRVEQARGELAKSEAAKQFAESTAQRLQERSGEFNQRVLKPLEQQIQRYHNVLSPFRYRIKWSATSGKSAPALNQGVKPQSFDGEEIEAQADAELSDGQMSVQSLSTLLAASTTYRWSRWRTLLLDDPLQSSDLLHTSSFLDIVRGLILREDYQIVLSSHDMEEAKYIIRKCQQSGITVTGCHLQGPTPRGVRYAIT